MNCRRLFPTCECGSPIVPHSLWLTDKHTLLMSGQCLSCEKVSNVVFLLTEMWHQCPEPDVKALNEAISEKIESIATESDRDNKFLYTMHITGDL